jgi:hypothetical protein
MSIRRRNDSVKPGCGIDGTLGENFTKQRTDPSFLRNKMPEETTASSRDIFNDVEGQSSDDGNRAVRSRGQA